MKTCQDCGKELSFWQRLGSGRCAACQGEADRKQEEARQLAARQAEERRRVEGEKERQALQIRLELRSKCPVCGSRRSRTGRLPDAGGSALIGNNRARFRPEENLIEAYDLEALACMDCGYVRLFLLEDDRAYLDQQKAPRA
jgi:DNA-directed RNA polymerase subunit RPC12/RpoP